VTVENNGFLGSTNEMIIFEMEFTATKPNTATETCAPNQKNTTTADRT
jgi:hypothetical protein